MIRAVDGRLTETVCHYFNQLALEQRGTEKRFVEQDQHGMLVYSMSLQVLIVWKENYKGTNRKEVCSKNYTGIISLLVMKILGCDLQHCFESQTIWFLRNFKVF